MNWICATYQNYSPWKPCLERLQFRKSFVENCYFRSQRETTLAEKDWLPERELLSQSGILLEKEVCPPHTPSPTPRPLQFFTSRVAPLRREANTFGSQWGVLTFIILIFCILYQHLIFFFFFFFFFKNRHPCSVADDIEIGNKNTQNS